MTSKNIGKKVTIILGIIIIITFLFCLYCVITALLKPDSDSNNNEPNFRGLTYQFSGKSEHFSFDSGKVYFSEDWNQLYIADFKQNKKIENIKSEKFTVSFDKKEFSTMENIDNLNKLETKIDKVGFYIGGKYCPGVENSCEVTAFDLATEDNFKDIVNVEMTYCTSDSNCYTEQFELKYVN